MSFLGEIKRRKVFQVAAVYAVVAWLMIQIVDVVSAPLSLPIWLDSVVIILLAVGFPVAVILAWAFDLTSEGVVKDQGTVQSGGRRIEYVLIGLLVVAVGWILYRVEVAPPEPAVELVAEEAQREVLPNSVAVLPFENLSPNPDDAYFAAGVHEQILNELAKIRDLNVIARTTMMRYANDPPPIPEIASELRVETVMEGSVRYAGDQVRVTAQLIDGNSGTHLWTEDYDGSLVDIFGIQSDIATQIAMALEAELSPEEQQNLRVSSTASSEAVRLYLLARSPGSSLWEFRLQYLDEAIRIDPLFARAYAERAYRSVNDLDNIDVASLPAREERIKSDIETALELDPTLGYAFVAQARLDMHHGRFDDARSAFENALALAPNDTEILDRYGGFLRRAEDFAEAVQVTQRAVALDPENSELHDALGDVLLFSGSLDATAAAYRRAIELGDPTVGARIRLGLVEMARGDEAEALSYLRVGEYMMEAPGELFSPALSYGYARLDRAADADRVREQFFQRVADGDVDAPSSSALALFSLAQDDVGTTLAHIRNAVENEIEPLEFAGYIIKYNLIADPILERREFVEQRSFLELR